MKYRETNGSQSFVLFSADDQQIVVIFYLLCFSFVVHKWNVVASGLYPARKMVTSSYALQYHTETTQIHLENERRGCKLYPVLQLNSESHKNMMLRNMSATSRTPLLSYVLLTWFHILCPNKKQHQQ